MNLESMTDGWFRHAHALVETTAIGAGTRVWAFAHVLPGARIGRDCNICDHVFIESGVIVGDRVTVKCGVQLWEGVTIEDDVFIGPNATFTNDPFPRSRQRPAAFTPTIVRRGASIGANATLTPGITVGANAMIGSGAVVTHDVPPNAIVFGNPAFIQGYVNAGAAAAIADVNAVEPVENLPVGGVKLYRLPQFADLRGSMVVGEFDAQLPFQPKRFMVLHAVPTRQVRGEHAFKQTHQFIVCLQGQCALVVDDGQSRREVRLSEMHVGVHIPPMVWSVQYKFSQDALVLVLASREYDPADYVRDYDAFLTLVRPAP